MLQFRSSIVWRLILWFLLLSLIPIGVVLVFVQRQVRQSVIDQQMQEVGDDARLFSSEVAEDPNKINSFVAEFNTSEQTSFILGGDGTYLAHPDPELIGKSAQENYAPGIMQELLSGNNGTINDGENGQLIGYAPTDNGNEPIAIAVIVSNITTVNQRLDELTSSIIIKLVVSLIITSLAGGVAILTVVNPILRLAEYAKQLGAGNLTAKIDKTYLEGEIAVLANNLEGMTFKVGEMVETLEQSVAERTAELARVSAGNRKRAEQLEVISLVAQATASIQNFDDLLPRVAQLVSERFDFYHVGIFLIDENRQFAILRAANSEGGKRMLDRGHRLEVGQTGIVGYVANAGEPRIALDVGTDSVFFNNPDLSATRSEMALPLRSRGQVIGVLDVQSTKAGAFSQSDADTLAIMADQIAIAIENARLFGESQLALAEVQSLYAQYLNQEWNAFAQKGTTIGYHQSSVEGRELAVPVETEEIRQVINTGQLAIHNPEDGESSGVVIMPIKLRGQVIGVLNIKTPARGRRWSDDEINMVKVISDRLALALENARLFEETTRTAERDKLVSDITSNIRSTNDPQTMIEIAVSELRRALGVSRVEIIPQRVSSPETDL